MSNDNTFMTLITGAALGACIGILYAPDKGTLTRKRIKNKALDTKHEWEGKIYRTGEQLTKITEVKKSEFEGKLETALTNLSTKGDEFLSSLELKLAELQKKNAQFKK